MRKNITEILCLLRNQETDETLKKEHSGAIQIR